MNLWSKILAGGAGLVAGAAACFLLMRWRNACAHKLQSLQAQSLLEKARSEAELVLRDVRLAANEETLKRREELEKSFTARLAERAEAGRRLGERETLVN